MRGAAAASRRPDKLALPMDLIVVAAEADAEFAAALERAFGFAELFEVVRSARVADEADLDLLLLKETRERDVLAVVVVSRALAAGVRSQVRFDEVLGTRAGERPVCVVVERTGAAAPPDAIREICGRRDAYAEEATAADLALRIVGRFARDRDQARPEVNSNLRREAANEVRGLSRFLSLALLAIAFLVFLVRQCVTR